MTCAGGRKNIVQEQRQRAGMPLYPGICLLTKFVVGSQALAYPEKVGIRQGFYHGFTIGFMNCTFLCAYALALWFGSTRVIAGEYTVRPPIRAASSVFSIVVLLMF
jgi:hypothetical protein